MTTLDVKPDDATVFAPSLEKQVLMPPRANAGGKSDLKPKKAKKGKGGKKGKAKPPAGAPGPGVTASEEELVGKAALYQWLFPTMNTIESVPSIRRLKELRTVQKIKDTLSKSGIQVPTSTIEQGILTPEYEPFMGCVGDLPNRSSGFSRDWDKIPITHAKPPSAKTAQGVRTGKKEKSSKKKK